MKTVQIPTAGKHHIEGTVVLPRHARRPYPAALFLHGWGSDRFKHIVPAEMLSQVGFVSLAVDLRGHGNTEELKKAVTVRDNLRDARAAYDFLASRAGVDPTRIALAGFSYGGFLSILMAAEKKVRWVALRSPALYRDEDLDVPKSQIKRRGLMAFRRRPLSPNDSAGLRAASHIKADVLVIEAEQDRVVPHQQIENYLHALTRAKSVSHCIISGADHAMSREQWYRTAVGNFVDWLAQKNH
jgi:uncharacterized protein